MKKMIATTTALVFALGLSTAALAQAVEKPATPPADPAKVTEKAPVVKPTADHTQKAPVAQAPTTKAEKQEVSHETKAEKDKKAEPSTKMPKKGENTQGKSEAGSEKKLDKDVPAGEKK